MGEITRKIHTDLCLAGLMKDRAKTTPASLRRPIATRHLIYHAAPFASNDVWLRNVRQLLRRIDLFNGRRVVAIATGTRLVDPNEVMQEMGGYGIDFLTIPNDSRLRERVSGERLLAAVESTSPHEATFYAHAKGVSTAGNTLGVSYWRNAMYHELLDFPEKIEKALTRHACVGTHRLRNGVYPDGFVGSWHFSGTFWWFRNDAFFSQPWRDILPDSGWGMEALPGLMFDYGESCCLFMDQPQNGYDPTTYSNPIPDDEKEPPGTDGLKVELGGGLTPRGEGYINVDILACADVQCDFDLPDARLPFDDNSVLDLYSSHCLEHIRHLENLMREIVRVCRIGARIELRVPHWLSNMAMCHGHIQTITHEQIDHWDHAALDYWWGNGPKKLKHFHTEYVKGGAFAEWRQILPAATDEQIMRLCPDACHESVFVMHVVGNS